MNLGFNKFSKFGAKHSSSETPLERGAPDTEWNGLWHDNTDLFSEMIEETLNRGHSIRFRAPGDSMYPTICDGDLITVEPIEPLNIIVGDIILYRHKNGVVAHRVVNIQAHQTSAPNTQRSFRLLGDAAVAFDDPVNADQILGRAVWIERDGCRINPYSLRVKIHYKARRAACRIKRLLSNPPSKPS